MRALLDVNVLVALLDSDHSSHDTAMNWFVENAQAGWASCPITQNGCVRVLSSPTYPNPLPVQALIKRLAEACREDVHEFWPHEASLTDMHVFDATRIHGPRQLTDTYLLGLAVHRGGRFVTFDRGIALEAVRNARAHHLVVL